MIIPEKIKIGNITYSIKIKKLKNDFGSHDTLKQTILIAKGISNEMKRNTLFHELTHAILFQIGAFEEQKNEVLVQGIANELDKLFEFKSTV